MTVPKQGEDIMDWNFHFILSKKISCKDIVNSSDIQFIRDFQNYLEGCDVQVNNADFAVAELTSKKKCNNLKKILVIKSGMETDLLLSDYKDTPKTGGFVTIGKTLRSSYGIEGGISKLDLSASNIQKLIETEDLDLEYLSSAVSHKYNGRSAESIAVGFKVIEGRNSLSNYCKFSCIRNVLSHDGPNYRESTIKDFDYYFVQNSTFDLKHYDFRKKIIVIDMDSNKTKGALDRLAGEIIEDAKRVLNL